MHIQQNIKIHIYNFPRETVKKETYWKRSLTMEEILSVKGLKEYNVMKLVVLNKFKCRSWGII